MEVVENSNRKAGENTRFSKKALRKEKIPRLNKGKVLESSPHLDFAQKAAQFGIPEDMITTNY